MASRGALFGSSAPGVGSTGGNKHIVEMRAGKMNLKGRTVYPDKRKGLLYVYQSDDSLMHFCWQDRSTGVVEDDLIIFPDDCEYVKVPQCTTGRVYLLKFKSSNRRFFFWLQEPSADKDEEKCKLINKCLNHPNEIPQQGGTSIEQDFQQLLNNMSQTQLMHLLGNSGQGLSSLLGSISRPSTGGSARTSANPAITHRPTVTSANTPVNPTTTPAAGFTTPQNTTAPTATTNAPRPQRHTSFNNDVTPIQLSDLQNYLSGISSGSTDQSVDLASALTGDALSSIMSNTEALEQLQSHLPPNSGSAQEQLRSTLQSPQFQQAVSEFSGALGSGQMGPVVQQLVSNPEAVQAAQEGNIHNFMKALEKSSNANASDTKSGEKDKDKDKKKDDKKDDDAMQLD